MGYGDDLMVQGVAASQFVSSTPGVISAGGTGLDLCGLVLTNNTRVPIGSVYPFVSAAAVSSFFGANATETAIANTYFAGYTNALQQPGQILFAQYPWASAVPAYLRGGSVAAYTLAQLQALGTGTVIVTINGTQWTSANIALGSATSFSNAATLIQTALAANDASCTGSISTAVGVTANTSTITGTVLTVVTMASGSIVPGAVLTGGSVIAGTTVVAQLTGTPGGAGTYTVSASQTLTATALTATNAAQGIFTVASAVVGAFAVGQALSGTGITAGTTIVSLLTGAGGTGTYVVSASQTIASETITGGQALVTYDSVSGAFVITGGTPGAVSTIGYATGTLAIGLKLTVATGATTSQGSAIATPAAFMASIVNLTLNWAAFMTTFEPVNADKIAFASWNNSYNSGTSFAYCMWSTDILDTQVPNTGSAWSTIQTNAYAGTAPIYAPVNTYLMAAFALGFAASLKFTALNGRATAAFKSQPGLAADVISTQVSANLKTNGVNSYQLVSTRNQANNSLFFTPGSISGPFLWMDSFFDQMWLNDQSVVALLNYLETVGSVPYNSAGYAGIQGVMAGGPIKAALNFGAIRAGVPLSATQQAYVNSATGLTVAPTITAQGWYLYISPATPAVRQARGSPPCILFYCDGQSIQQLSIQSLEVA